jgi:hypothetical protein
MGAWPAGIVPSALNVMVAGVEAMATGVPVRVSAKSTFQVFAATAGGPAVTACWVIVTLTGWALPRSSYMLICEVTGVVDPAAERLPPSAIPDVATGASTWPLGILRSPIGPLTSTVPPAPAVQPCSFAPSGVTRLPTPSTSKDPARVKRSSLPCLVTKKPSPLIMKSLARPVFWVEPWPKLVVMPATLTPRPTWAGLVPALSPCGEEPLRRTWDRVSSKTVVLLLKPTVFTLAMLLPVTSSFVWCAFRPEMAENMERSMGRTPRDR